MASTGGPLVDRARETEVPVVGLPGIFQPRAAVAYMVVVAAEVASLAGVGPRVHTEIDAAAAFLAEQSESLQQQAREIAALIAGAVPVIYGSDLTAPVARRWKTQVNENAKFPAFWGELPEADHNEILGWAGRGGRRARGGDLPRGPRPASARGAPLRAHLEGDPGRTRRRWRGSRRWGRPASSGSSGR